MELLTTAEAARHLNVPLGTLHYWRSVGGGPRSLKLGRRVMYRREALDRFVAEQESAADVLDAVRAQ